MSISYDMYQEQILDHYKHPRNKGPLAGATENARDSSPLCGDEVGLHVKLDSFERIAEVKFEGQGCTISQASASMLTTMVKGMPLSDAEGLAKDAVLKKLGIPLSAVRLKCALLRSEEHTSELQSRFDLVCRLLLEKKKNNKR